MIRRRSPYQHLPTNHFTTFTFAVSTVLDKSYFLHFFGIDLLHTVLDWLHRWLQRNEEVGNSSLYFNKLVDLTTVYQVLLPRQLHPFHQVRNNFIDKLFLQSGPQFSFNRKSFLDQVFFSNNTSLSHLALLHRLNQLNHHLYNRVRTETPQPHRQRPARPP